MTYDNIQTVQFRRGSKAVLEQRLKAADLGVLQNGEPAYETDTKNLKIGDGINDYINLSYIGGGSGGEDPRFVIHDPIQNQVLLYDDTTQKWINKDLADPNNLVYLENYGLTIKGYHAASQGQMPVKDANLGLAWVDPVTITQLQEYVDRAQAAAVTAGNKALQAADSAATAGINAEIAERINEQTMNWVNKKFWWGTLAEYNALTSISPGTFYFISSGV